MAEPTLNPYEYQYGDDGVLLNGDEGSTPFIDITGIQGLDIPDFNAIDSEYDGRHGGYVYARFVKMRTIILDGILYADPSEADAVLETLIKNFMPSENDKPFYYKGTGIDQRYIMCKPIGFNSNISNLRGYGACQIQIQLKAGDPVKYVDKADLSTTSGTNNSITNNGNVATYPVVTLTGASSEISIVKLSTGETVTITYATDADDEIIIDFRTRSCLINGEKNSSYLTSLGWWAFEPDVATAFKILSTAAELMINGNCDANFGAGYAVGSNWTGTQQYTGDAHTGTKSLKMYRKNTTPTNGTVVVPTGVSGLSAGAYTASVWVKGTMPHVNVSVLNDAAEIASVVLVPTSSTEWTKIQLSFTLASTSGTLYIKLSDTGDISSAYKKGRILLMDDFSIKAVDSVVHAVVSSKDGWL